MVYTLVYVASKTHGRDRERMSRRAGVCGSDGCSNK